ncbi:MAG: tryptophan synthase subunit alpha [Candidatus Methylumidiphilus sp.]
MSRITPTLENLRLTGRKALIPFITAGDPNPSFTVPAMHAMVEAGADIIELGVPFSDPMADGPVIQRASERALVHKMSLRKVLGIVKEFRQTNDKTPVVLMGYLNPIEALGYRNFVEKAREAGVDGVLTVDLPPEESSDYLPLLDEAGIDPIFLLAPNSTQERIAKMGQLGRGYLYYVSLKGVTGASNLNLDDIEQKIKEIRQLTQLPIEVGFGVKNAETAAAVAKLGDGVVVGSALVGKIESAGDDATLALKEITALLGSMRSALDA